MTKLISFFETNDLNAKASIRLYTECQKEKKQKIQ